MNNYIYYFTWEVITQACPNVNDGLASPPLKQENEWEITSYVFRVWLFIPAHKFVIGLVNNIC